MVSELEYDDSQMRRSNPAVVAVFVLVVALALVPKLAAQINGTPPSVTSLGFGGHTLDNPPGVPASVTSLGPNGFNDHPNCCRLFTFDQVPVQSPHHHRRDFQNSFQPWGGAVYGVPYAVPYPVVVDPAQDTSAQEEEDYRGGPTIFDRRGSGTPVPTGERSVARRDAPDAATAKADSPVETASVQATSVQDQPQTVLVFKDGHQLDVANYAVIGSTLYDLTPGHRRKIELTELDLTATAKQNDDRGIDFQLPPSPNMK